MDDLNNGNRSADNPNLTTDHQNLYDDEVPGNQEDPDQMQQENIFKEQLA
jgi:hypothetical protein